MHVYEKVKLYIYENGYKPASIADKAGISPETFDEIMNGKRTMYADDLCAICIALNVSPEIFIDLNKPATND